jgi:hypothetical protein
MPRPATAQLNLMQLQRLIRDREKQVLKITRRRSKLQTKIDALDRQLAAVAGSSAAIGNGATRTRARNDKSLIETLEDVLKGTGKPMRVADIADACMKSGYRSNSANFRGIVNQTLIKDKRFSSPSRGFYTTKK